MGETLPGCQQVIESWEAKFQVEFLRDSCQGGDSPDWPSDPSNPPKKTKKAKKRTYT